MRPLPRSHPSRITDLPKPELGRYIEGQRLNSPGASPVPRYRHHDNGIFVCIFVPVWAGRGKATLFRVSSVQPVCGFGRVRAEAGFDEPDSMWPRPTFVPIGILARSGQGPASRAKRRQPDAKPPQKRSFLNGVVSILSRRCVTPKYPFIPIKIMPAGLSTQLLQVPKA